MLALLALIAVSANHATQANVPVAERMVLMEIYSSTGGGRWSNHSGWATESSVCDWYGVSCDFLEGDDANHPVVVGLSLSLNNLEGTLPASLAELRHLKSLSLSDNRLSGIVPEAILERWDRHELEFDGFGNTFSNLVLRASVEHSAVALLCSATEDVRYRIEFDEPKNRATFQSVRCASGRSRKTYCLVREGTPPSLARLSRGLRMLRFTTFRPQYDYPFSSTTHGVYLTTEATWGDGSKMSVETYNEQGPIEVWSAQQLFLGLLSDWSWERETRRAKCDFQE